MFDIQVMAIGVAIAEAESFEDIALDGRCKRDWRQRYLALPLVTAAADILGRAGAQIGQRRTLLLGRLRLG